jgi:alpha-N-arabinofuranosidase
MHGLSLHNYTVVRFPAAYKSVGFDEADYALLLSETLKMDGLIRHHGAIMDAYDPEKRLVLAVDEWGAWYAQLPGTTPGFLAQQNSIRDALIAALNINIFTRYADRVRMANIAQMINVLQAMILTDGAKMILTPTYHVFRMYVPFQDATVIPVTHDAGRYTHGDITLPRVDAIAARDASGTVWLSLTNLDPTRPAEIVTSLVGVQASSASGETLTAPAVDSVNTFEAPTTVSPRPISAQVQGGRLTVTLEPKSVTVLALRP